MLSLSQVKRLSFKKYKLVSSSITQVGFAGIELETNLYFLKDKRFLERARTTIARFVI